MTRFLDCGRRTRGARCVDCARRRDRVRNRGPAQRARLAITRAQRQRVYSRDGRYACVTCGAIGDLTLDHIVRLADNVKPRYADDDLVTSDARAIRAGDNVGA